MRRRRRILLIFAIVAALVISAWLLYPSRSKAHAAFIHEAERIELMDYGDTDSVIIDDPETVRGLVSGIVLIPKEPCRCAHDKEAIFLRGGEKLRVSICDHCFNVIVKDRWVWYEMPNGLYDQLMTLEDQGRKEMDGSVVSK